MAYNKYQSTGLNKTFSNLINRLESWSDNPWRKYSLFLIIFLSSFFLGSSLGMINGALAYMDPVGALITVLIIEIMVRIRSRIYLRKKSLIVISLLDMVRIGLIYGLFLEGFKLL
tara:strand:- start:595 stop:939 length:345 start_codon:yes stop_codon:yes gene_type:complete